MGVWKGIDKAPIWGKMVKQQPRNKVIRSEEGSRVMWENQGNNEGFRAGDTKV